MHKVTRENFFGIFTPQNEPIDHLSAPVELFWMEIFLFLDVDFSILETDPFRLLRVSFGINDLEHFRHQIIVHLVEVEKHEQRGEDDEQSVLEPSYFREHVYNVVHLSFD